MNDADFSEPNAAKTGRRRRKIWVRFVAVLIVALIAACAGLTAAELGRIWNPSVGSPQPADAIVVLASGKDRRAKGRELANEGYANNLVLSVSHRMAREIENGKLEVVYSGSSNAVSSNAIEACGEQFENYRVWCFTPDPHNTVGEARAFAALAAEQGWDSVLLVTERSHLGRATRIFERCYPGETYPAVSNISGPWYRDIGRSVYELVAGLKDRLTLGC